MAPGYGVPGLAPSGPAWIPGVGADASGADLSGLQNGGWNQMQSYWGQQPGPGVNGAVGMPDMSGMPGLAGARGVGSTQPSPLSVFAPSGTVSRPGSAAAARPGSATAARSEPPASEAVQNGLPDLAELEAGASGQNGGAEWPDAGGGEVGGEASAQREPEPADQNGMGSSGYDSPAGQFEDPFMYDIIDLDSD